MAQEPVELLLEHRKSTSLEGYSSVPWMLLLCVSLALAPLLFMREDRPERFPIGIAILWYGLISLATLGTLKYALSNIKQDGVFCCRLTTESLECDCPVGDAGESFSVQLSRITRIERDDWSEGCRWYIWDDCERRHWLTANYGNPAGDFVKLIKQMRPALRDDLLI